MYYTLNQLKKMLTGFFENHKQIVTTKYENDFDFAAEKDVVYPAAVIQDRDFSIQDKLLNYSFQVWLIDLLDEDKANETVIVSDMLQIADDFFTWLQYKTDIELTKNLTIQKIVDQKGDRVSGVSFRLTLGVWRKANECQIPTES